MSRARVRKGREVAYFPTSSEESDGGGSGPFPAKITQVKSDGSVNLIVFEPDGSTIAKSDVKRGQQVGQFGLTGLPNPAAI